MSKKAIFIISYFGEWPFWFDFFLFSCERNPDYHWLIVTDCGLPNYIPDNVTFEQTTLSKYCEKISTSLNINFSVEKPYKFCDVRPALGFIHKEDIQGYSFWGYCDVDVIFGDINSFITDSKIRRYDLITSHERRVSGHLTLIRNGEEMNALFRTIPDWQTKMLSDRHFSLDEKCFSDIFIRHKNLPKKIRDVVNKFYPLPRTASLEEAFSTPYMKLSWVDGSRKFPKVWFWNNGKLLTDIDGHREFPYLHFKYWKDFIWPDYDVDYLMPELPVSSSCCWSVSEVGFRMIK